MSTGGFTRTAQKLSAVNGQYTLNILIAAMIILYVLIQVGCVSNSPGLSTLFLISVEETRSSSTGSDLQLLIGYFGICVRSGTATSCATSNYNSPSELMSKLRETTAGGLDLQSYSDLIARSIVLQNKILAPIPLFAIAGVLFMLSNTAFVMWKRNVKSAAAATERSHRSRRHLRTAGVGAAWVSLAVAVNASTAMHMTTNALAFAAARDYTVTVGSVSTALHWVISGLSLVFAAVITLNLLVAGESGLLAQQAGSYAPLPMSVGPAAGGPTAGAVFRGPSAGLPAGPPGGPRAAGPPAGLAGPRMPGPPGGIARGPPGGGV